MKNEHFPSVQCCISSQVLSGTADSPELLCNYESLSLKISLLNQSYLFPARCYWFCHFLCERLYHLISGNMSHMAVKEKFTFIGLSYEGKDGG